MLRGIGTWLVKSIEQPVSFRKNELYLCSYVTHFYVNNFHSNILLFCTSCSYNDLTINYILFFGNSTFCSGFSATAEFL